MEGANTVSVSCESGVDKIDFDWFEADYERSFAAAADSLKFTHAGGYRYGISGFSTEDVELFDISEASAVKRVVNGTTSGSGPYALEVEPPRTPLATRATWRWPRPDARRLRPSSRTRPQALPVQRTPRTGS